MNYSTQIIPAGTLESVSNCEGSTDILSDAAINSNNPTLARPVIQEGEVTVAGSKGRYRSELTKISDKVWNLSVEAASETVRLGGAIATTVMSFLRKPGIVLAGAAIGVGTGVPENLKGALIPDGADPAAYINNASQFQGSLLWIKTSYHGQDYYSSAVRINSEYAITAAHVAPTGIAGLTIDEVGTGSNYTADPGTIDPVASYVTYPGYDFTLNGPDIAIVKFANPLPGPTLSITGSTAGEEVTMAGFGEEGTPSTGLSPQNGASEAFNVLVSSAFLSNVNPVYYNLGELDATLGIPLNGKGADGDSGGPVFDNLGNLVGIMDASSNGNSPIGGTEYLNFGQPDVQQFIANNTVPIPEPGSLFLVGLGAGTFLLRRVPLERN